MQLMMSNQQCESTEGIVQGLRRESLQN